MEKKKLQISLILSVTLGTVLFVCLLLIATFFDLDISKAFTKGSLAAGEYYSHNQFALIFEVFGGSIVYIAGGVASLICVSAAIKMEDGDSFFFIKELKGAAYKAVKIILVIVFSAFAVYEMYEAFHDVFKYTDRYLQDALQGSDVKFALNGGYLIAVQVIVAFIVSALILTLVQRIKKEDIIKLIRFAILVFIVEAMYLILIGAIKTPIGRMRFRTMNALGDFSYYTPWYKINGARNAVTIPGMGVIPSGGTPSASILVGAATDTCKSFPSGHTYCAAMSFVLVCLPDMFDFFKKKYIKVLCWVIPAVYTVTVAVCRIVVGAHFLSDVLVGGTLSFVLIMIIREVLILRGAHFKAFKKDTEVKKTDADEG